MNTIETYSLLFADSFFANLAINISNEIVIHTMKAFSVGNPILIIIFATLSFIASSIINYVLGKLVYVILAPSNDERKMKSTNRIEMISKSKFLPIIFLFSAVPVFGKFIILFSGFCKLRFLYIIILSSIVKLIYYTVLIFLL